MEASNKYINYSPSGIKTSWSELLLYIALRYKINFFINN